MHRAWMQTTSKFDYLWIVHLAIAYGEDTALFPIVIDFISTNTHRYKEYRKQVLGMEELDSYCCVWRLQKRRN
jgi:hypothetical protein